MHSGACSSPHAVCCVTAVPTEYWNTASLFGMLLGVDSFLACLACNSGAFLRTGGYLWKQEEHLSSQKRIRTKPVLWSNIMTQQETKRLSNMYPCNLAVWRRGSPSAANGPRSLPENTCKPVSILYYTTLHYTTLHCSTLLYYTRLHYTTLY